MHHIICDGWSLNILKQELLTIYDACKYENTAMPAELKLQYKDYADWQNRQLGNEAFQADKAYWLDRLSGEIPIFSLPSGRKRPTIKTYAGHRLITYLPIGLSKELNNYCKSNGGSLFIGLLTSWHVLLYRYTNEEDIVIGSPTAGREHTLLEEQIGFYLNILPLRNTINPNDSFNETFQSFKESTLEAFQHQMYPY